MAVKKAQVINIGQPQVTPQIGIGLLTKQYEKGMELISQQPLKLDEYESWELLTKKAFERYIITM